MDGSGGNRVAWADVPAHVRTGVEGLLGSVVVEARSQPGGFSPGSADRVLLADGRRAFVKAVGAALNPDSPDLHRREASVAARLPRSRVVPRLLTAYDDGDWVALVLEDVEGRPPRRPWTEEDVLACLAALETLAGLSAPEDPPLPSLTRALVEQFAGWRRWKEADDRAGLDPWAAERLPELDGMAHLGLQVAAGDALVHNDVRADNLLLRPDGSAVVVDWPHANQGAAWFDTLCLLHNVELVGGADVDSLAGRSLLAEVSTEHVAAMLAGHAAYFSWHGCQPPVPGLPRVREFQRAQGDAALRWLRRLWAP